MAEGQQNVEHRASAWTAVGKKCLERGCVYIKDYVIVEGEGAAAAAGKGAATGKALRGERKWKSGKTIAVPVAVAVAVAVPVDEAIAPGFVSDAIMGT